MKEKLSTYWRVGAALTLLFSSACQAFGYENATSTAVPTSTPEVDFDPTMTPAATYSFEDVENLADYPIPEIPAKVRTEIQGYLDQLPQEKLEKFTNFICGFMVPSENYSKYSYDFYKGSFSDWYRQFIAESEAVNCSAFGGVLDDMYTTTMPLTSDFNKDKSYSEVNLFLQPSEEIPGVTFSTADNRFWRLTEPLAGDRAWGRPNNYFTIDIPTATPIPDSEIPSEADTPSPGHRLNASTNTQGGYLGPDTIRPDDITIIDTPNESNLGIDDRFEKVSSRATLITYVAKGVLISDETGKLDAVNTTYLEEVINQNQLENFNIMIMLTKGLPQITSDGQRDIEGGFNPGGPDSFYVFVNLYGPTAQDFLQVESEEWWFFEHLVTPCTVEHELDHAHTEYFPQPTPLTDAENEQHAEEVSNKCIDRQASDPRLMFIFDMSSPLQTPEAPYPLESTPQPTPTITPAY